MQKSSKKEKITGPSQFYGKLYERSNFCNNMDKNSNKKKLSEIMTGKILKIFVKLILKN